MYRPRQARPGHACNRNPPACKAKGTATAATVTAPSPGTPANSMARGLSRELSREKNAKKGGGKAGDASGLTPAQRAERDGAALAEKQARKAAQKAEMAQTAEGKVQLEKAAAKKAELAARKKGGGGEKVKVGVKDAAAAKAAASKAAGDRQRALDAKAEDAKAGGGAAGKADKVKELEKQLMPKVKQGDSLIVVGDVAGAMALYQEALAGFVDAGLKRPKLSKKIADAEAILEECVES